MHMFSLVSTCESHINVHDYATEYSYGNDNKLAPELECYVCVTQIITLIIFHDNNCLLLTIS